MHPSHVKQTKQIGFNIFLYRYGQEVPGERLEILQQPLALGYLASTAGTGPMPRWFWAAAPHLESVCPVFLKSALHINIANLAHGGDDGLGPGPGQSRHSLDSNYTTDVLRSDSWILYEHNITAIFEDITLKNSKFNL